MNFSFEINKILPDEITKVDNKLQVCRQYGQDRYGFRELKKMLFEIVDKMGDASAKAQRLPGTITTGSKLENTDHHLYVMKDVTGETNCVIGILKVGTKKLFVYDPSKRQHELDPMCVLDFYVHESRQRMGCGRKLFDYMLATESIPVKHMAVDRPSPKFLSFLKKHYHLHAQIPQVNNYVIFDGFFQNRNNSSSRFTCSSYRSNTSTSRSRPNSGRKSSTPLSTLRLNPQQQPQQPPQVQNHGNYPHFTPTNTQYGSRQSPNYLAANERMYSRHSATPPNPRATPPYSKVTTPSANHSNQLANGMGVGEQPCLVNSHFSSSPNRYNNSTNSRNDDVLYSKNSQGIDKMNNNYNKMASPYMQYAMGTKNTVPHFDKNNLHMNAINSAGPVLQQQEVLNESHQPTSAPILSRNTLQNGYPGTGSANGFLPDIRGGTSSHPLGMGNQQKNINAHRPPSGKRTKPSEPPELQRDGPPAEYRNMLNMHQAYQGRNGRFVISETRPGVGGAASGNSPLGTKPPTLPSTYGQGYSNGNNNDWNWSMSGHLREQRMKQNVSNRYNPARLW